MGGLKALLAVRQGRSWIGDPQRPGQRDDPRAVHTQTIIQGTVLEGVYHPIWHLPMSHLQKTVPFDPRLSGPIPGSAVGTETLNPITKLNACHSHFLNCFFYSRFLYILCI